MPETNGAVHQNPGLPESADTLDARLGRLFMQQRNLRELLETTRVELDQVNREVLRVQEEFCTTPEREAEYDRTLVRVLGFPTSTCLQEIEEIMSGKQKRQSLEDLLGEIEREAGLSPSRNAE